MDELITRFLEREFRKAEKEEKGPAVVIDPQKLEQLENDSEVVRSLLTVEESVEPEDEAAAWSQVGAVAGIEEPGGGRVEHEEARVETLNNEGVRAEAGHVSEAVVETSLSAVAGEAEAWVHFASVLSPLQREVVLALAEADGALKAGRLAAEAGTMAELLYDEINELAMDNLGDLVIDGEELTEECILMLDYLKR